MMVFLIVYGIGFALTIAFFIKFGKKIGFDYSGKKTYVNYDDWDSNTQAYTWFSLMWPIMMPILTVIGLWKVLTFITGYFIEK